MCIPKFIKKKIIKYNLDIFFFPSNWLEFLCADVETVVLGKHHLATTLRICTTPCHAAVLFYRIAFHS